MNKSTLFILLAVLAVAVIVFIIVRNSRLKGDKATVSEQQQALAGTGNVYKLSLPQSLIHWMGAKPIGKHFGTFNLSEGTFTVDPATNLITGGKFIIDMNSLVDLDMQPGQFKDKLVGHLKSPDFFDVEKHPAGTFEITKVVPHTPDANAVLKDATHLISGNLTLKDSTKNISFPAKIIFTNGNFEATADFNIDRTMWGIHYGNDKSLGDSFVYPEVNIKLDIRANKE